MCGMEPETLTAGTVIRIPVGGVPIVHLIPSTHGDEMKPKEQTFRVTLEIPNGCSVEEVRFYIWEAVTTWAGSFEPGVDPLFDLNRDSVKVTRERKPKKAIERK